MPYSPPILMLTPLTMSIEIGETEASIVTGVLEGDRVDYEFAVVDPEYLTAPVLGHSRLQYRPDVEVGVFDSDRESARRFLDVF